MAVTAALAALHFWSSWDCLRSFFHFDDFWVLAAVQHIRITSPADLLQFFEPIHGLILYRPLSTLGYFYALRKLFEYQPVGYHAVQIAWHVVNGILVYGIADQILLDSRWKSAAVALIYATAPGHAIATCWNALFTMTGAAFWYFAALLVWVGWDSRWRVPSAWLLFLLAILSSEHGASLPLALTLASLVLLRHPWRRSLREQAAFYLLLAVYLGAKVYYAKFLLAHAFPDPLQRAVVQQGYALNADPGSIIRNLGRYLCFAIDGLYALSPSDVAASVLGTVVLLAAGAGSGLVIGGRWRSRSVRAAVFGLDLFLVGLGPVLVLQSHLYSYYIGIAAAGTSLCVVSLISLLPRGSRIGILAVVLACLSVHFGTTAAAVRQSEEFRFFRGFTESAARWLYSVDTVALPGAVDEVVVPRDSVTSLVFDVGRAQEMFLCARYKVRTAPSLDSEPAVPRHVILARPFAVPSNILNSWQWLRRECH